VFIEGTRGENEFSATDALAARNVPTGNLSFAIDDSPAMKSGAIRSGMRYSAKSGIERREAYAGADVACPVYFGFGPSHELFFMEVWIQRCIGMVDDCLRLAFDIAFFSPYIGNVFTHFACSRK
jgi:hypothetical protein